ncbi:phage tail tape measure protein [Acinetobacter sp. YH12254]|uniref:phage tail tape measure protein n=1 Tax=Acinetobacter sp. YH12254 TaxID=2601178 RepID=UPI0015D2FCDB|nr:phage tail tape measure protein [Acinetobacter sp. YH12254]
MATSLGTLTLDLVTKIGNFTGPMQQAEKQTKISFDNMRAQVNTYGMAIAGIAGSAAMALGSLAVSTANQAAELEIFANRANTTTQEFQKMAVGASAMGIEGDKLSDMMKDFNEKMGELTAVGAGGGKDFFDKLSGDMKGGAQEAKGLILEMQKLSGPEALQMYVDKLEDAGVSQQEMSFYLESMASDMTDLYPLLANGGEGMKLYGDMAERAGLIMTDQTKEAALALKDQMFMLDLQMQGAKNQLVTAVIPAFVDVADAFLGGSEQGLQFTGVAEGVGTAIRGIGKVAIGATASIQVFGKGLGGLAAAGSALVSGEFQLAKSILAEMRADISTTALDAAAKMDDIDNRVGSSKSSQLRGIREIQQRNASTATGLQDVIDKENKAAKATEGRAKAAKKVKELTHEEIKLKELQFAWEVSQHRLTEDEAFRYKYSLDQQSIRADKELTAQQKEIKLQALKEIYEGGYTALKLAQEKELLETKRMYMTAGDYAREYYDVVRKEILNTVAYSPEMKEAKIKEVNLQQGIEQNAERENVWGEYQDRFDEKDSPYQQDIELLAEARKQMLITEEDFQRQKLALQMNYGAQYGTEFAGALMGLVDSSSSAYRALYFAQRAFALSQAGMNVWKSASDAYANEPGTVWQKAGAAALAAVESGTFVSLLQAAQPANFAEGGWTGYGGKYEVAGLVHRGEGVLTQEEIRALGGPEGFYALRHSIKNGFAGGGLADPIPAFNPKIPRIDVKPSGSDSNVQITQHITFTDSGAQIDTKGQKALAQGFDSAMMAVIRRESRQGGFIYNELRRVKG